MKTRILFVDDEPPVLQGLQRMLHSLRHEWDTVFAASGAEALEKLGQEPFDVVVSDMRMPGMDGAQLLAAVKERYPQVIRIVLSGHSDKGMVMKTVKPAHQYLAKPCDDVSLKAAMERARLLREMLADESLRRLVSQIETLPSLPSLYVEITEELQKEHASIKKVGDIISQDIGMTAKILQLVNSAFFGLRRHIASPAQAAELLGLETIKVLVLSVQIFSQFDWQKLPGLSLEGLRDHSFTTGVYAKTIALQEKQGQRLVGEAFMAGVLHDTGKLILAANLPDRYQEVLTVAQKNTCTLWESERQVLGVTHTEMGSYLLALWGLPQDIVEATAYHHEPSKQQSQEINCLTAVHVANALTHAGRQPEKAASLLDQAYITQLHLEDRLLRWQEACQKAIREGDDDDL